MAILKLRGHLVPHTNPVTAPLESITFPSAWPWVVRGLPCLDTWSEARRLHELPGSFPILQENAHLGQGSATVFLVGFAGSAADVTITHRPP